MQLCEATEALDEAFRRYESGWTAAPLFSRDMIC